LALAVFSPIQAQEAHSFALQDGDIVFSGSTSGQGAAISKATASPFTHCGIVFKHEGRWMVLEAVQPVGVTTLEKFMASADKDTFTARRLKTAVAAEALQKARKWATAQVGIDYDLQFSWDDKKLYCSELVWKFFEQAGIELCEPRRFRDYDLEQPLVKKMIEQRYGSIDQLPMDEKVVAPSDIEASNLLVEVPRRKN
jgi:uncharacterized protein YycO